MERESPQKSARRPPLLVLVLTVLIVFLGSVWLISRQTEKLDAASVTGGEIGALAPIPPAANFIDRSAEETFTIERGALRDDTIKIFGGGSTIEGSLRSAEGQPLTEPAIVELIRWEGNLYNPVRVNTNSSGEFKLEDVYGGRWSARGWIPNKFGSRGALATFILQGEIKRIEVTVGDEESSQYQILVTPETTTSSFATVTLVFSENRVDENGRLAVSLPSGEYSIRVSERYDAPRSGVIEEGASTFIVSCVSEDESGSAFTPTERKGTIVFEGQSVEFTLPACVPPPTTTTTTTPETTLVPPDTTTSTTTTSTTVPSPTPTLVPAGRKAK